MNDHVLLTGVREDARALLPAFDALICTSRDEQGPVAVIEGLAGALPVLSTHVGMVPTMVEDNRNGLIFDTGSPQRAIDYLMRLAGEPGFAQAQGAAGYEIFKERFAPDPILEKFEAVMARIIREASDRRHGQSPRQ